MKFPKSLLGKKLNPIRPIEFWSVGDISTLLQSVNEINTRVNDNFDPRLKTLIHTSPKFGVAKDKLEQSNN